VEATPNKLEKAAGENIAVPRENHNTFSIVEEANSSQVANNKSKKNHSTNDAKDPKKAKKSGFGTQLMNMDMSSATFDLRENMKFVA